MKNEDTEQAGSYNPGLRSKVKSPALFPAALLNFQMIVLELPEQFRTHFSTCIKAQRSHLPTLSLTLQLSGTFTASDEEVSSESYETAFPLNVI